MTYEQITAIYYAVMVSILIFVLIIAGVAMYNTSKCDELSNVHPLTHTGDNN